MITRTLSHFTPVPNSDYLIFGVADYEPRHAEQLQAIAASFGAAFNGLAFYVHREVAALHPDYAGEVLTAAANRGL